MSTKHPRRKSRINIFYLPPYFSPRIIMFHFMLTVFTQFHFFTPKGLYPSGIKFKPSYLNPLNSDLAHIRPIPNSDLIQGARDP